MTSANTNSDSVEFGIPQLQDESQLIAVAPAVVIPIGIGAYKLIEMKNNCCIRKLVDKGMVFGR